VKIYLVSYFREKIDRFETVGVFSTEEKAIQACKDENFCWNTLILDESTPEERHFAPTAWPHLHGFERPSKYEVIEKEVPWMEAK
jgi:hypothetical protein